MAEIDLAEQFPDLELGKKPAFLARVNGCGASLYGQRDYDEETGTYVKTWFLCLLWIPLIPLAAYRVVDAEGGGWFILGKVPLSTPAKAYGALVLITVAGFFLSIDYRSDEDKLLDKAAELESEGRIAEATEAYLELADLHGPAKQGAEANCRRLLDLAEKEATGGQALAIFEAAGSHYERNRNNPPVRDLPARAARAARRLLDAEPAQALALIRYAEALEADDDALAEFRAYRREILVKVTAASPGDVDLVTELALLIWEEGDLDRCFELLEPLSGRLGEGEGARILGHCFAQRGQWTQAIPRLEAFFRAHLEQYRRAEREYAKTEQLVWDAEINRLDAGDAPQSFYRRYEAVGEEERERMVVEYLRRRLRESHALLTASRELERHSTVVTAGMSLGVAHLQLGLQATDPAQRQEALERAEQAFLAIQSGAEGSSTYQLSLGEVYYWLGRPQEGRTLFDRLLLSRQRDFESLMAVANALRDVGALDEARAIMEEAYERAGTPEERHAAAELRVVTPVDNDDQMVWVGRCDQSQPHIRILQATSQGDRCAVEARYDEARGHYRRAIQEYDQLPEDGVALHNCAIVHHSLYVVTGSREELDRSLDKFKRALKLLPDSGNTHHLAAAATLRVIVADRLAEASIDLTRFAIEPDLSTLSRLYRDRKERDRIAKELESDLRLGHAIAWLERALLFAPRNAAVYRSLAAVHAWLQNEDALRALLERARAENLDGVSERQALLDYSSGKHDQRDKKRLESAERFLRERLGALGASDSDATRAGLIEMLLAILAERSDRGDPIDTDEYVRLAEQAHAIAPSARARSRLGDALLLRAETAMFGDHAGYADGIRSMRRLLSVRARVACALTADESLVRAFSENEDVRRALDQLVEVERALPDTPDPSVWAILRVTRPEDAAALAVAIDRAAPARLSRELSRVLAGFHLELTLDSYWEALARGQTEAAAEILSDYREQGLPIPPWVQTPPR